jgi:GH15 family glucan-1,4-alpha-glucosidase
LQAAAHSPIYTFVFSRIVALPQKSTRRTPSGQIGASPQYSVEFDPPAVRTDLYIVSPGDFAFTIALRKVNQSAAVTKQLHWVMAAPRLRL